MVQLGSDWAVAIVYHCYIMETVCKTKSKENNSIDNSESNAKAKSQLILFLSTPEDILSLLFRETGRERKGDRNINVTKIDFLPPACTWTGDHMHPDQGLNLQPRHAP